MRIQHNIMAMSAYRNYNTNTSAVAKNLEKLSSGYKINRAGDDAAGLAISEKMRAQITGLNAAQKNVKDGISLVKTAEGAMQEIQDMLNRMSYLATQSANGTYDNETDRAALQKEVNQLREEINRIADSANFNGIKLLNGNLDKNAVTTDWSSAKIAEQVADNANAVVGSGTIVHSESLPQQATKFNVDFGNSVYTLTGEATKTVSLKVGDTEFTVTEADIIAADGTAANKGDTVTADNVVKAFLTKYGDGGASEGDVTFKSTDGTAQAFKMEAGTAGNQITFTQVAAPNTADEVVNGAMSVVIKGVTGGGAAGGADPDPVDVTPEVKEADIGAADQPATAAVDLKFDAKNVQNIVVGGKHFQINPAPANGAAGAAAIQFAGTGTEGDPFTFTRTETTTDEEIVAGIAAQLSDGVTIGGNKFKVEAENTSLKFTAVGDDGSPKKGVLQIDGADATEDTFTAAIQEAVTSSVEEAPDGEDKPAAGALGTVTTEVGNAATTDATAKLEITVALKDSSNGAVTPANNDTVTITAAGADGKNGFTVTFKTTDGTAWSVDGNQPTGYTAAFDGSKVTLTSTEANKALGLKTADFGAVSVASTNSNVDADKSTATPAFTDGSTAAQAKQGKAEATLDPKKLKDGDIINVGDKTLTVTDEMLTGDKVAEELGKLTLTDYSIAADAADGKVKITLTEKTAGAKTEADLKGAISLTAAQGSNDSPDPAAAPAAFAANAPAVAAATDAPGETADYNASTEVIQQGADPGSNRLASTYMEIKNIKDGSALKVGDKTYIFAVGKDSTAKASGADQVLVDMTKWNGDEANFLDNALNKLTDTVNEDNNAMFSVGYQGNGKVTFTEQETYQNTAGGKAVDLSTRDAIAKQFGYAVDGLKTGKALNLQIGDTSEQFNRLEVSVGDMHTTALKIDGIDISNQTGAADAISVIKDAINTVSGVRGDLGAYQNRLEHTANNLSVMAENIQDAESAIRDTDIAEEMMSYTKNNILVQSAQAMLAQANQVPQGVLQLLG